MLRWIYVCMCVCTCVRLCFELMRWMWVGGWVLGGDTLPRIAFNLLTDTAVYDSHLSTAHVRVCLSVCVYTLAGTIMFSLVGVGVQVVVYCNIAPSVCNSQGDVGAQQSVLVVKTLS